MKIIKIISLILLILILATYFPIIASKFDNHPYYSYRDMITGQEWEISKVKKTEYPINLSMTNEEYKQYNDINNELEKANNIINENQKVHENYIDDNYTDNLTLDDLGVNGGNTLSEMTVTFMLHQEAQKRLQKQNTIYMDALNNTSDLNRQMNALDSQLTNEAWDLRNTINNVKIFSIIALLLLIFSKKLLRLFKKVFSFIIND